MASLEAAAVLGTSLYMGNVYMRVQCGISVVTAFVSCQVLENEIKVH